MCRLQPLCRLMKRRFEAGAAQGESLSLLATRVPMAIHPLCPYAEHPLFQLKHDHHWSNSTSQKSPSRILCHLSLWKIEISKMWGSAMKQPGISNGSMSILRPCLFQLKLEIPGIPLKCGPERIPKSFFTGCKVGARQWASIPCVSKNSGGGNVLCSLPYSTGLLRRNHALADRCGSPRVSTSSA
jgi:hypothetical protein